MTDVICYVIQSKNIQTSRKIINQRIFILLSSYTKFIPNVLFNCKIFFFEENLLDLSAIQCKFQIQYI